jgi:hypothetical protein
VIPEACKSHQLNLYIHNPFTVDDYSLGVFKSMHTLIEVDLYLIIKGLPVTTNKLS